MSDDKKFMHLTETSMEVSPGLTFSEAFRMLGTAAVSIMQGADEDIKKRCNEEEYQDSHNHIYDSVNILFGNILDMFDNTKCPATDLTAEAILRAENEILDEAAEASPTETEETESPA